MMIRSSHQIMIMFIVFICFFRESSGSSYGFGESKVMCKVAERRALLDIKAGLFDDKGNAVLSSWGEEEAKRECCSWTGIRCNSRSGHVVSLDLSYSIIKKKTGHFPSLVVLYVSSSLVHLEHLNYLILSGIDFNGTSLPSVIGNLSKLRHLDLSYTSSYRYIPPQLGNLSKLQFLDLSNTNLPQKIPPQLGNLSSLEYLDLSSSSLVWGSVEWASRLSSLRVLHLGHINMSTAYDWANVVTNLPHLIDLGLSGCSLPKVLVSSSLSLVNSSKTLSAVDLSGNSISDSIFQWLFNYNHSLVHLDLSYSSLTGYYIPRAFENMASLEYISLVSNIPEGTVLKYFPNLSNLKFLYLNSNNLEGSILNLFSNITTLKYLNLGSNKLGGSIPESFGNMSSLEHLHLENNMLEGEIPKSISEICTLETLNVGNNNLSGQLHLPQSPSRCSHFSLKHLDLSENQITGTFPNFTMYPSLISLRLSSNRFYGIVPETIGQLSKLEELDVSENLLNGVISEVHFLELSNLYDLNLSNTSLVFNTSSHWNPPFQLNGIYLGSCQLGPHFPKWLHTQKRFIVLDLSNSQISDPIPDWFWDVSARFQFISLANNQISGSIRDRHSPVGDGPTIDLSSNQLEGSIPLFLLQIRASFLSHNRFSSLSSICNATDDSLLCILDVSFNQLAGELPDCWSYFNVLSILDLRNNNFFGNISLRSLSSDIQVLNLGNNSFTGNFPESLSKPFLSVLDVADNRLVGPLPRWIGSLKNIAILNLRSNGFNGKFPTSLCSLPYIQVLDLSSNNISGELPNCVGNLTAMRHGNRVIIYLLSTPLFYSAEVTIMWKGKFARYQNTLNLVKSIDLSKNKLTGKIPSEITELEGLIALNLSRNCLAGNISTEIGNLKSLEVLDLSRNHLSGNIPLNLSALSFLNTLDVSNNNLSGKIPTSTQLQSFDPSSYSGNPELCGDPLPNKCPREDPIESKDYRDNEDDHDSYLTQGFYVSLGLGFIVGFWGICGSLLFIKSWRYACFTFLNSVGDWLYVLFALQKGKLMRTIKH